MEEVSKKISYLKPEPLTFVDKDTDEDELMGEEIHYDIRSPRSEYSHQEFKNILDEE